MKLSAKIVTSALVVAVVAATGVTAFAVSDSANPKPDSPMGAFSASERPEAAERRGQRSGERPAITEEQRAEWSAKAKELLDQQLADGKLTQEQYDQAVADLESGNAPAFGRGMDPGERPELTEEQRAEWSAKAKELLDQQLADGKLTQEQYDQAIENLESGNAPAFGRGMDPGERPAITEEQRAEWSAKAKELLDQQLADGKLTQEQYDQAIENLESGNAPAFGGGMEFQRRAR